MADDVVVVGAVRTPIGSFLGQLSAVPAPRLGAAAVKASLERAGVAPDAVDQVILGNVLQASLPARDNLARAIFHLAVFLALF